jgi:hypothetical protein
VVCGVGKVNKEIKSGSPSSVAELEGKFNGLVDSFLIYTNKRFPMPEATIARIRDVLFEHNPFHFYFVSIVGHTNELGLMLWYNWMLPPVVCIGGMNGLI